MKTTARPKAAELDSGEGMGSVICMYIENHIGVILGLCLGYAMRVLVERMLTKAPTTSQSLEELDAEWEDLKRRVDQTFGTLEKPKTGSKARKK